MSSVSFNLEKTYLGASVNLYWRNGFLELVGGTSFNLARPKCQLQAIGSSASRSLCVKLKYP